MPLPNGVPALPPGRFYRIREDRAFSRSLLEVQIRQRGAWFSWEIESALVDTAGYVDAETAVRAACHKAVAKLTAREDALRAAMGVRQYLGDHYTREPQ